jgi:hypothetical protein
MIRLQRGRRGVNENSFESERLALYMKRIALRGMNFEFQVARDSLKSFQEAHFPLSIYRQIQPFSEVVCLRGNIKE